MRDPNRIEPMLEALKEYWLQNPDLRLGQIISNMARLSGYSDPFFIEDRPMMDALKERTKKMPHSVSKEELTGCGRASDLHYFVIKVSEDQVARFKQEMCYCFELIKCENCKYYKVSDWIGKVCCTREPGIVHGKSPEGYCSDAKWREE